MADKARPPAYNPEFCDSDLGVHSLRPRVNTISPPPYCENISSGTVKRSRRACSSSRLRTSRSHPALCSMSSANESPTTSAASQSARTGERADVKDERHRCNSVGRGRRRRFQFDTIGRERGRRPSNDITAPPPPPPPRQLPGEPVGSPLKCLQRFNVYSLDDIARRGPHSLTCVDVSDSGSILIVDSHNMLVHVFSSRGNRLCRAFKILGVRGGCFWKEEKLVLPTHRGLKICQLDGSAEMDMPIGPIVCTKRYKLNFIAVQRQRITFYGGLNSKVTAGVTITKVRSRSFLSRGRSFVEIADVAVNKSMLVVLDIGRNAIYRIDEKGTKISKVVPNGHLHNRIRFAPGVAVDACNNVIVCDGSNKQLLQFQANGSFVCCLLNFSVQVSGIEVDGVPLLRGITTNYLGQLFITLSGNEIAEVRVYRL